MQLPLSKIHPSFSLTQALPARVTEIVIKKGDCGHLHSGYLIWNFHIHAWISNFNYPIKLFMIYMDTDAAAIKKLLCIIIGLHTSVRYLFTCQRKDSSWFLEAYHVLINLLAKFLVGQPELSSIKIDCQWIIFQPMAVTSSGESRDGKQRWKSFSDRCKLSFSSVHCGFASCLHILLCKMGSLLAGIIHRIYVWDA